MNSTALPVSSRRLIASLLPALLGQGPFAPGRADTPRAVTGLGESLGRWLDQHHGLVMLGGNPADPVTCSVLGLAEGLLDPATISEPAERKEIGLHLAGFWRDRRLALICLRRGLTSTEFEHFYHLLSQYAGKGLKLRRRLLEEQVSGHLPHLSLVFLDDIPEATDTFTWPARTALAWVQRDLNILSRVPNLPTREKVDWREYLLGSAMTLTSRAGALADFFAGLETIAEQVDNYDKDELVFALLEVLDNELAGSLCLELCTYLERFRPQEGDPPDRQKGRRYAAVAWVARRLAEHMLEEGLAGPEHLHALVLHKVLLYEEIPRSMRPRVASLQVLTSFLNNPQKYFTEVENSHSPEVLETRLWRILEMVPRLIEALRFDVARQVLEFSLRFGPTFELQNKPEIMSRLMDVSANVLLETTREQQAALMKTLPQMGRTGTRVLIDLADHGSRPVRRTAIDTLIRIGPPVVPILFEFLEQKDGWHYLRNMLLVLVQLNTGGPKVAALFRESARHPEPNVRKEALPGLAKLLRAEAAAQILDALDDPDAEVRKRAATCLGVTGIPGPDACRRLAEILSSRECSEELAIQIVASISRARPKRPDDPALESALLALLGTGGFLGIGARKKKASPVLRSAIVQALGFVGGVRSRKALAKLPDRHEPLLAKVIDETLAKLSTGSH